MHSTARPLTFSFRVYERKLLAGALYLLPIGNREDPRRFDRLHRYIDRFCFAQRATVVVRLIELAERRGRVLWGWNPFQCETGECLTWAEWDAFRERWFPLQRVQPSRPNEYGEDPLWSITALCREIRAHILFDEAVLASDWPSCFSG